MSNARSNVDKLRAMSASTSADLLTFASTMRVAVTGTYAAPFTIGTYHSWVDATGDLRLSTSTSLPSTDTSGVVVGTQS